MNLAAAVEAAKAKLTNKNDYPAERWEALEKAIADAEAAIENGDAANKKVTYSIDKTSKNKKYTTISSKGVLTTKKAGKGKTVTITATATDGSKKKATIKVKITK